ncbi:MAG: glycosyltransferase [Solirubrobacterales bacterium]
MRIGIVSKWFNRGQPVVGRYLRSALDELGHETYVLARPKKERGPRPGALDRDDVWEQPGITEASAYDVPMAEYEAWASDRSLEVVFCDQNYQFDEIDNLRRSGIRTVGRFVWEAFAEEHVAGAQSAFEIIYSFTRSEQERYRGFGIESPYVTWGIHPELLAFAPDLQDGAAQDTDGSTNPAAADAGAGEESRDGRRPERQDARGGSGAGGGIDATAVRYVFPGGFIGHRKPLAPVVEAFRQTTDPSLRLLIKSQVDRKRLNVANEAAESDPRIEVLLADEPREEHLRTMASCDVCLALSRWEGLGLPLYESIAFGMPVITNDKPPMNEPIEDGVNGLLVTSHPDGEAKSGIPAFTPDVDGIRAAIEELADPDRRAELGQGARQIRDGERSWSRTVDGMGGLIDRLEAIEAPSGATS